jgi:biotin carboxyl carrier protein
MLNIKVNNQQFQYNLHSGEATLDGKAVNADTIKLGPKKYHLIINHQSYTIELLEKSDDQKTMSILVNGVKQEVSIKDKYDHLLSELGMDKMLSTKANIVKAPMPGLVLRIIAKEGDQVKKGDAILVLEAMKMENVIKADGEGIIKKICVSEKQAVEKNTVLVELA